MAQIFVSHSNVDNGWCRPFRQALIDAGHDVWYDERDMPLGQPFPQAIGDQIEARPIFVVILSPDAWISHWVQTEINTALAARKFIVPVLHRQVDVTGLLRSYERIDATALGSVDAARRVAQRLAQSFPSGSAAGAAPASSTIAATAQPGVEIAIPARLGRMGFSARRIGTVEVILPPLATIPAGPFTMGSDSSDTVAYDDEKPQYLIPVDAFELGRYPVTVAEYALYLRANAAITAPPDIKFKDSQRVAPAWRGKTLTWAIQQREQADHPVVGVSWINARDYVAWLAKVTGQGWRLPTEAEWEKAARGTDGRIYPWGNTWDNTRANTFDGGPGMTTPIGTYAERGDAGPYTCHDMAGNVWEWTSSLFVPYPFDRRTHESQEQSHNRVLRGGSWYYDPLDARAASRLDFHPVILFNFRGFRAARGVGG